MKVAIIFSEGIKQINFTPENDDEKQALNLISPDDNIELAVKTGSFGESNLVPSRHEIAMCSGGYLRKFPDSESIMFVLSPKKEEVKNVSEPEYLKYAIRSDYRVLCTHPVDADHLDHRVIIDKLSLKESEGLFEFFNKSLMKI